MLFIREERLLVRLRQLARPVAAGSRGLSTRNPPSLSRFPKPQGLYDAAREVDSCGVGMVAHLKGQASHSIVSDANVMLVRMAHRGGCGCDPASGDGAGILTGMPDGFLRKAVKAELGITLPPAGEYAAGNIFFPKDPAAIAACKGIVESQMRAQGLGLIGWRPLPVDNSELGPTSLESEPHSEMLLVSPKAGLSSADFNRELYRLHKLATKAVHAEPSHEDFYVNSLSTSTIVSRDLMAASTAQSSLKTATSCCASKRARFCSACFSSSTLARADSRASAYFRTSATRSSFDETNSLARMICCVTYVSMNARISFASAISSLARVSASRATAASSAAVCSAARSASSISRLAISAARALKWGPAACLLA